MTSGTVRRLMTHGLPSCYFLRVMYQALLVTNYQGSQCQQPESCINGHSPVTNYGRRLRPTLNIDMRLTIVRLTKSQCHKKPVVS